MRFYMIDGDKRHAKRICQCFGIGHAHKQAADKPRASGHRHRVHVRKIRARVLDGLFRRSVYGNHMVAAGKLGNHSAVKPVQLDLRIYDVG